MLDWDHGQVEVLFTTATYNVLCVLVTKKCGMNLPSLLCQMNVWGKKISLPMSIIHQKTLIICGENTCLVLLYCAWYTEAIWPCQQREGAGLYILTLLPCLLDVFPDPPNKTNKRVGGREFLYLCL